MEIRIFDLLFRVVAREEMVFQGCSVMDGLGHSKAFEMVKIGDQIHTSGEKRKHAFESEDSTSDVGAGEDGKQKEIGMPSIDEGHWRSNHVASADRCPSSQSTRCNCKLAMSGRQDKGVDYFSNKILFDETIQRKIVVKPPVSLRCDLRESLLSDESCSVLPKGQEVEAPKPLDIGRGSLFALFGPIGVPRGEQKRKKVYWGDEMC